MIEIGTLVKWWDDTMGMVIRYIVPMGVAVSLTESSGLTAHRVS